MLSDNEKSLLKKKWSENSDLSYSYLVIVNGKDPSQVEILYDPSVCRQGDKLIFTISEPDQSEEEAIPIDWFDTLSGIAWIAAFKSAGGMVVGFGEKAATTEVIAATSEAFGVSLGAGALEAGAAVGTFATVGTGVVCAFLFGVGVVMLANEHMDNALFNKQNNQILKSFIPFEKLEQAQNVLGWLGLAEVPKAARNAWKTYAALKSVKAMSNKGILEILYKVKRMHYAKYLEEFVFEFNHVKSLELLADMKKAGLIATEVDKYFTTREMQEFSKRTFKEFIYTFKDIAEDTNNTRKFLFGLYSIDADKDEDGKQNGEGGVWTRDPTGDGISFPGTEGTSGDSTNLGSSNTGDTIGPASSNLTDPDETWGTSN